MTCVLRLGWCDAPLWAAVVGMLGLVGLVSLAVALFVDTARRLP